MDALTLFQKSLKTFDEVDEGRNEFYNHLPYKRDSDLCHWEPDGMVSGNLIKYYQYQLDQPVII